MHRKQAKSRSNQMSRAAKTRREVFGFLPIIALAAATVYLGFDTRLTAGIAAGAAEALIGGLK